MRLPPRSLLPCVLVVALACSGPTPDPVEEPTPRPTQEVVPDGDTAPSTDEVPERAAVLRYVALGDSIAAGFGASTSYVTELTERLEETAGGTVRTRNAGVPGRTTPQLLAAVRDDDDLRTAMAEADVVTFNTGGNDLLPALWASLQGRCGGDDDQACLRTAVDDLTAAWDELLDELVEVVEGDTDRLRTMTLYRPGSLDQLPPDHAAALQEHLDAVNDHLTETAQAAGIAVADVHAAFHGPDGSRDAAASGLLAEDGIHPSDRGHEVIAAALAELGAPSGAR